MFTAYKITTFAVVYFNQYLLIKLKIMNNIEQNSYIINNESAQMEYIEVRRAEKWIPFLIPHLKPGFKVLDCGCGIGTLTLDIAKLVYPGEVIGIDIDEKQLTSAREKVKSEKVANIQFNQVNVQNLPYKNETFDVIIAHTLLIHLPNPLGIIKEFYNLLKPGGIVAISDDDWGSAVQSPSSEFTGKGLELMAKYIEHNGGNPYYSRHLRSLLLEAGFEKNEGYAHAPEHYGTLEETRRIISVVNGILQSPDFISVVLKNNWTTEKELIDLIEWNKEWAERPDAFAAHIYCSAIGWKPSY